MAFSHQLLLDLNVAGSITTSAVLHVSGALMGRSDEHNGEDRKDGLDGEDEGDLKVGNDGEEGVFGRIRERQQES